MTIGTVQHLRSARAGARPGDGTVRSLLDGEVFINTKDGVLCYLADSGAMVTAYFLTAVGLASLAATLTTSPPAAAGVVWVDNGVIRVS